jgi:DNA-binding NtrC family response regulator
MKPQFRKPQLLWADADTEFTFIGQRYLAACGVDVVTTAETVSCLSQLICSMPNILVLDDDLQGGGVDGILMWLQEEVPSTDWPVVIVSGDASPEAMSVRTGVPVACCLQKPYRLQSILDGVGESADHRGAGAKLANNPQPSMEESDANPATHLAGPNCRSRSGPQVGRPCHTPSARGRTAVPGTDRGRSSGGLGADGASSANRH